MLEMVVAPVAAKVTAALDVPTIGIGAGPDTDGQVLVWLDALGMADWSPSFSKHFGEVGAAMRSAAAAYVGEVKAGTLPDAGHSFSE